MTRNFTYSVAALCISLCLFSLKLSVQDNMGKAGAKKEPVSVTGCVHQGVDKGGYFITTQDGTMYELFGKNLKDHVNQQVTVTGKQFTPPAAEESRRNPVERSEAAGESFSDLKVSDIKAVSDKCSQ